ncbi:FAD-dependent monooxygenase [Micromonospora sp. DT201]|uniref:FAD-dependent monooxygenase n=1 Tax=Micromonospora sp. DT201 TaxID=3393442 RepID=UPI003CF88C7C
MRVSIIGAGVAGSASAIALRRIGADVTVHEAYPDPAGPVGSFVSLAVNGLRALESLGCLPAVRAAGFPVERQRMWSGRGKLLGDVARGRRPEDPWRSVTLLRADLVGALRDAAADAGARLDIGTRVTLADVLADERPDLVVAADGIWSATRSALDPDAPAPRYAGIVTISGVSPRPDVAARDGFNWVFGRDGVFIYLPTPDGQVWWSAQIASRHEPEKPTVDGHFRTEPVPAAILDARTAIRSTTVTRTLRPVRRRHDGRTVLVGDAAHPAGAGQGASMALEDAVILARSVAAHERVDAALGEFDRLRLPRAGKLAKMEARNRDAKTSGALTARVREIVMPIVFDRVFEKATGWLYATPDLTLPVRA